MMTLCLTLRYHLFAQETPDLLSRSRSSRPTQRHTLKLLLRVAIGRVDPRLGRGGWLRLLDEDLRLRKRLKVLIVVILIIVLNFIRGSHRGELTRSGSCSSFALVDVEVGGVVGGHEVVELDCGLYERGVLFLAQRGREGKLLG